MAVKAGPGSGYKIKMEEASEEMSGGDYLQDPDMWDDRLPQPYRLIDKTLMEILEVAWEAIENREIERQQESAQVKVPSSGGGHVVCGDVLTQSRGGLSACGGRDALVVGNGEHVHILNSSAEEIIASLDVGNEINATNTYWKDDVNKDDVNILYVQLDKEIEVLGLVDTTLIEMAEISYQYKDQAANILDTTLSHTSSHMGVTLSCCSPEEDSPTTEIKLAVYTLPVESWVTELSQTPTLSKQSEGGQDITYSRPVLLYIFTPPPSLAPSNTPNPHFIFQSVCDESGKTAVVPSGDLHSLTELYFSNRRTMFASNRLAFMSKKSDVTTNGLLSKPTCHFLYYKSTHKLDYPCQVAVWWQDSVHLALYKLEESTKSSTTPHPSKLIPQASAIISSATSKDTGQLALALKSGAIVILDTKIGMCTRVVQCVDVPDSISTLKFFHLLSSPNNALVLGVGTEHGKILVANMTEDDELSLNSRTPKQEVIYGNDMFGPSGYDVHSKVICFQLCPHFPSLLTTLHADGTTLLWNPSQQEPVCKFQLGEDFVISPPISFTFSSNGHHIFIAGKQKDLCNVLCFNLTSTSVMDMHSPNASTEGRELEGREKQNTSLLDGAEAFLEEFLQLGFLEKDKALMRWEEHWKELPNTLIKQIS